MAKMTVEQIDVALQNPNVQKMLAFIQAAEGTADTGYGTGFGYGYTADPDFKDHPNRKVEFTQTDGKKNVTTAAGAYQFVNKTWKNTAKQLGLTDFSPKNQDRAAVSLIAGRGALNDVINGDMTQAINKLGGEWASLPSSPYKQKKHGWDFAQRFFGGQIDTSKIAANANAPDRGVSGTSGQGDMGLLSDLLADGSPALMPTTGIQANPLANQQAPQLRLTPLAGAQQQEQPTGGTLDALTQAIQPLLGKSQGGVLGAPITLNGRNVMAVPETAEERNVFSQVAGQDINDNTKNDIIRAFAQIQPARNELLGQDIFGASEASVLDPYLRDIVENV